MLKLEKYSIGTGDRFGKQAGAQLESVIKADAAGTEIAIIWNKSHREHAIIHTDPNSVRLAADNAVKAAEWKGSYYVDADHIGLKTVDLFMDSSDFFTLDVADFIGEKTDKNEVDKLDLSTWRIAGVGAEPIRTQPLERFADLLAPSGFDRRSFVASYGMAECSLAVSFAPLGQGTDVDHVDGTALAEEQKALPLHPNQSSETVRSNAFTNCGAPLPGYEVEVRDAQGQVLPERHCGTLYVRGPSVMSGYFGDLKATREVLSPDGWLNTGDLAYRIGNGIVITGREKDLIIINGRNIWPQDLEYHAEQQPEVRTGDASAFSVTDPDGGEKAVMMVQCRESDEKKRSELRERLHSLIREEFGIDCLIELVPRNTLPRTTSGKLSRSGARKEYLKRIAAEQAKELSVDLYTATLHQRAV